MGKVKAVSFDLDHTLYDRNATWDALLPTFRRMYSFDIPHGTTDAALLQALKSADRLDDILVLGVDGSDDALASIEKGELSMTALQDAKGQAEAGAKIFADLRDGTDPKDIEDVYIPFQIVTKDNVAEYLGGEVATEAATE